MLAAGDQSDRFNRELGALGIGRLDQDVTEGRDRERAGAVLESIGEHLITRRQLGKQRRLERVANTAKDRFRVECLGPVERHADP